MRRNLGRSLLSFSFSRSNRIGSDELIAGEKTAPQSRERLAKLGGGGDSWVDVGRLMDELAEKETVISDLRRKLQHLELQNRSQPGMARSASIISVGAWLRRLSRRSSTTLAGVLSTTKSGAGSGRGEGGQLLEHGKRNVSDRAGAPSMRLSRPSRQFTYEELMGGHAHVEEVNLDHLELYLIEDDVMEWLGVCTDFLPCLDPGELEDRKYQAFLTRGQFLVQRSRCPV